MADIRSYTSDLAFTPSVKALQTRRGSRDAYARMEMNGSWETRVSPDLALFIEAQTSVFLGTANTEGQPYIQHRGGPPGFLRILDDQTIGFADFRGNRQYITLGNLADNPKALLFLIDYTTQASQDLGRGAGYRRRHGADRAIDAERIQGAAGTGGPLQRARLGCKLSAAHPTTA